MAAGIVEVIGLFSAGLGLLQFGLDNFASPDPIGSVVRITVGLDFDGGLNNAGGDLPDVRLFNEAGNFIGANFDPGKVGDGSTGEVKVDQIGDNGQQAAYALFSADDDAICVAYASITWPEWMKEKNPSEPGKDSNYVCNAGPPFPMYTTPDPNSIVHFVLANSRRGRRQASTEPGRNCISVIINRLVIPHRQSRVRSNIISSQVCQRFGHG